MYYYKCERSKFWKRKLDSKWTDIYIAVIVREPLNKNKSYQ